VQYIIRSVALNNNLDAGGVANNGVRTSDYHGDFNLFTLTASTSSPGYYQIKSTQTGLYLDSNSPDKNVYQTSYTDSDYTLWKPVAAGNTGRFRLINLNRERSGSGNGAIYLDSNAEGRHPYCSKFQNDNTNWYLCSKSGGALQEVKWSF